MTKTAASQVLGFLCLSLVAGCARPQPAQTSATAAPQAAPPPRCQITGKSVVVASNVYVGDVHVDARPTGGFTVAVLDGVAPCLNVSLSPKGELVGTVLGECPAAPAPGTAAASSGYSTYLARQTWDAAGSPRVMLGVVTYEAPRAVFGAALEGQQRVVEHRLRTPSGAAGGESDPALATYQQDQFALAWVQGDTVRVQPVGGWAKVLGQPLDVVIPGATSPGTPALAFDARGEGLVTYAAQTDDGYNVFATPIACTR